MKNESWGGQEKVNQDMAEALEFGVGMGLIQFQRSQVTDDIWHLIIGSYAFGINPLPILRKALPNFEWQFHNLEKKQNTDKALRARVIESDFFWFKTVFYDQVITARRRNTTEKPLMIIGQTFQSILDSCAPDKELIESLKSWGVREDREEHFAD